MKLHLKNFFFLPYISTVSRGLLQRTEEAINIPGGVIFKQRHWSGNLTGHATACVT